MKKTWLLVALLAATAAPGQKFEDLAPTPARTT